MNEVYLKPEKLKNWNVCHWYEAEGVLLGSQKGKAKRFLDENCIKKINEFEFKCLPIEGYNKTTHNISYYDNWKCSCQFNRNNKECSHIMACKLFNFMEEWNR